MDAMSDVDVVPMFCPKIMGDGAAPGDQAGAGKRLQNAHGRRGALHRHRDERTRQNAQNGILQRGEQADEQLGFPQCAHRICHHAHADEQQAEAHENLADVALARRLDEHEQHRAHKRQNGRERGGLKEFHQHAAARNIGKPDDLARHRGADVGAHDDADGLGKLHDARVDKAHHNDRGTRAGLDERGDDGPESHGAPGGRSELLQDALHPASGVFLQPRAHDGHAVQKQRQAARQTDNVENGHTWPPVSPNGPSIHARGLHEILTVFYSNNTIILCSRPVRNAFFPLYKNCTFPLRRAGWPSGAFFHRYHNARGHTDGLVVLF